MKHVGNVQFTIHGHGLAIYPPGASFGPRRLVDYEFVWIVDGDAVWECDGQHHPAPAGTVTLARPGMCDGYAWDRHRPTRHGFVHFDMDLNGADIPAIDTWPLLRQVQDTDIIRPLFRHISWLLSMRGSDWQELLQGAMRQVLMAYITGASGVAGEEGQSLSPLIERTLDYVREQWGSGQLDPLTLGDLARAAAVTRGHLTRVFNADLGVTPMEALRLMRLDRAATLLARSNLAVQEVAAQSGFDNAFHFSRVFRETYGDAPREFRKRIAGGAHLPTIRLMRVRQLSERLWHAG